MPETRADSVRRSNEEIVNYHDVGDARGRRWLDTHPSDSDAANRRLRPDDDARPTGTDPEM